MAENKTTGEAQVSVPVPQDTKITVTKLSGKTAAEIQAVLEKAKTSKVGFVILNAPFKVRSAKPVS